MFDFLIQAKLKVSRMSIQRVTANLPEKLLRDAMRISKLGLTDTLIAGLEMLCRKQAFEQAQKLKGKIQLRKDEGRKFHDKSRN